MYKWRVKIVKDDSGYAAGHWCSTGPGSPEKPAVGDTVEAAARNFLERIGPDDGGWFNGAPHEFIVEVMKPDVTVKTFITKADGKQFIDTKNLNTKLRF